MAQKKKKDGLSLRTIHIFLIIATVVFSAIILYATFYLSADFKDFTKAAENHISLRKDALELMDASDYLTENVQRFTLDGDKHFLDEYFNEAFEMNHRENAIKKMSSKTGNEKALEKLKDAMDASNKLMKREYYAMRLVVEAKGYKDYPEQLKSVALSGDDKALSASAKMQRATKIVLDDEYYAQKNVVRKSMRACLDELERTAAQTDTEELESLHKKLIVVRTIIIVQTLGLILLVLLTSHLGIHPILNAVDRIKDDSLIPEKGAREFRYLVRAYNKMYKAYKKNLERLNFKASHDELTGAFNRAGYDSILESVDLNTTYFILFDVDDFKSINDKYGHEIGDEILIKLTEALNENFRDDDYICRIGGDEFVVFMLHSEKIEKELIASKIAEINDALANTDDGLPSTSISVGVAHGSSASDEEELFKKADEAMYNSKQNGKQTFTFSE